MSLTLDRPASRSAAPIGAPPAAGPVASATSRAASGPLRVLAAGAVAASVAVLGRQLAGSNFLAVLSHVRWVDLAVAVGFMAVSMVAGAYNLIGFTPRPLRLGDTVLAQLAVGGLRLIAPSAVSTPAVASRYLMRVGASGPEALTTVAVAQSAQFAVTLVLVAGLGALAGRSAHTTHLDPVVVIGVAVAVAVAALVVIRATRSDTWLARRLAAIRAAVTDSAALLGSHARRRPGRVLLGLGGSALLTASHVLAFAFCVRAAGGSGSALALTLIYLGAASAGSLVPTPGGLGAVEAALIGGLGSTGLSLPTATAAALLSRAVSVWLPAIPGAGSCYLLRRRGLL